MRMAHVGYPNRRPCGFIICFLVLLLVFLSLSCSYAWGEVAWGNSVTCTPHSMDATLSARVHATDATRSPLVHATDATLSPLVHATDATRSPLVHALDATLSPLEHATDATLSPPVHATDFLKHFDNCCDDELRWKMVLGESSCVNPKNRQNQLRQNYQFGSFCL